MQMFFYNMVSSKKIHITRAAANTACSTKTTGGLVDKTIFQLPGKYGKGILVTPTVHGNTLIGPTADDHDDKEATNTTRQGLDHVCSAARRPCLPFRSVR